MSYTFGPFRYDAEQKLLFRGSEVVPLVPKVVETLHVLLERRGRSVENYRWGVHRGFIAPVAETVAVGNRAVGRYQKAHVPGALEPLGDRTRVTSRLAGVHSGKLIWAANFDAPPVSFAAPRAKRSERS